MAPRLWCRYCGRYADIGEERGPRGRSRARTFACRSCRRWRDGRPETFAARVASQLGGLRGWVYGADEALGFAFAYQRSPRPRVAPGRGVVAFDYLNLDDLRTRARTLYPDLIDDPKEHQP